MYLDSYILDPLLPRTPSPVDGYALWYIDPLYRPEPGLATRASTELEAQLASLQSSLPKTMGQLLEALTHDGVRSLPITALRGDWLLLEHCAAQIWVNLVWADRLLRGQTHPSDLTLEQELAGGFPEAFSSIALERTLRPPDLQASATALMDLVKVCLRRIHERIEIPPVDSEGWFAWICQNPMGSVPTDVNEIERAAARATQSLAAMPACLAVLQIGSFPEPRKRDGFNDVDMVCYSKQPVESSQREAFLHRLGLKRMPRADAFEYFNLDSVNFHLSFALLENQLRAIQGLQANGDESASLHFLHPQFAPSAYALTTGAVLHDPMGVVASFLHQLTEFPPALADRVERMCGPAWLRVDARLDHALRRGDRVDARIAARYASELAMRIILARHGVYANPITPKWLPMEVQWACKDMEFELSHLLSRPDADSLADQAAQLHRLGERLKVLPA